MTHDPIVEEIHAVREEIARRNNYDLHAIAEALGRATLERGLPVVSLPPRPVVLPTKTRKAG